MSDNDNVWKQPEAPPPPLFTGKKEKDLVKQVTDEIVERVVKSEVVYYPISVKHSNFHDLYGEAIDKSFLPPVRISAYVEREQEQTSLNNYGLDKKSSIVIHFHKRRITEDQNLFVREGDFVLYGEHHYEIVALGQPRPLFGQIETQIEIVATCIRARDGVFPEQKKVSDEDDPRLTAAPCDPVNELNVLDGTGTSTGGSGTTPVACEEISERPSNPPPPLFTGKKSTDLVKQVNDEMLERVIGQQVVYFPVSVKHSNFHDLYGEAVKKTFLPPMRVFAAVSWEGSDTTNTNLGIDRRSQITVRFHKRRLSEDQNLFVREGDFVLYGKILYEITTVGQPRQLFGQVDQKFEIVATCIRSREGVFKLSQQKVDGKIIDMTSTELCDNATLTTGADGEINTVKNLGTGIGLFSQKVGRELQFKSLLAGPNIDIDTTTSEITIGSSATLTGSITNALTASIANSASYASQAVNASTVGGRSATDFTLQYITNNGNSTSASITAVSFTGSLFGTASHSTLADRSTQTDYILGVNVDGAVALAHTASYIIGSAVNGAVSNATNAVTAQTASYYAETDTLQSVTSRGSTTTGTLSVSGLSASINISASGFYGDGSNITGVTAEWDGSHNGDATIIGNLSSSMNMSASAFYGDGSNITGVTAEWDGSHTGNATIDGQLSASSGILASTFTGNGSALTNITAGNIVGAIANATNAVTAQTASYYAETDTLQSVTARGATSTGTLSVAALSASTNISASGFYGDGSNITGVTAEWDGSHTGNATIIGNLSASISMSSSAFYGNGANLTAITAGNIVGTVASATNATNAVTAQTASYVVTAQTASYYAETDTLQSVTGRGSTTTSTLAVAGLSASVNVSASGFYGDGSSLTGVTAEWDGSHTGNATIIGNLSASINMSASAFYGDGSKLTGISTASTLDQITDNGATTTNDITVGDLIATALTGSLTKLRNGNPYLIGGSNVTLVTGSNGQITISSTGGGGGTTTIGNAEDGSYTDGLFTDFTSNTSIGVSVDRFNEILKILAPSPAPDVSKINCSDTGVSAELSFGAANTISGYTNVATLDSFAGLDVNDTSQVQSSGNNLRRATFNGSTVINGEVNFHVATDTYDNSVVNYPADSFGNAETGSLQLFVNGAQLHSIDLTSDSIGSGNPGSGNGSHLNGAGSGFYNVSTTSSAQDRSQNQFSIFQHRTADYKIAAANQRNGWNYAEVKHSGSWGLKTTNHVQWVNDNNNTALTATNARFTNAAGSGSKYLSGVKYFTSITADYLVDVNNAYKNVYTTQNISFTNTNCTISSQGFPPLNTGAGEDETKVLRITGSATSSGNTFLSGTLTSKVNVAHPLKSDLNNAGTANLTGLLIYNISGNSTALRERFKIESYRLSSGSYDNQSDVDSGTWNSQTHMTASGHHSDGLQFYNARLYSPLATLNDGDFRDNAEGGPLGVAPPGNPDYSSESGLRSFFRYFRNSTGATKRDIVLTINGSSTTIVPSSSALNSGRIRAFIKIPGSTGFMDVAQSFTFDDTSDGSGAYVLSFDNSVDAENRLSFGTTGVANGDDIVLKIEATTAWTGYVDDIVVSFGAGTGASPSDAPVLDDIDINDNGQDAKLSFGSSKPIGGYSNVTTTTGNSAVDLNGNYVSSLDIAGIFDGTAVIDGELNEDVSANSPSYVANSFNNAATGSLKLEVNGAVIHEVDLASASVGSGNPGSGTDSEVNGNGSGFVSLSNYDAGKYSGNNLPDYTKMYRTGKYQVTAADQRNGWNYARVFHTGSEIGQTTTNYVEWVNDNDSNALASAGVVLDSFSGSVFFSLSGVKYFTTCSSSYRYSVSNVYKNVYYELSDGISFPTTTNTSVSKITTNGSGLSSPGTTNGATKALPPLSTSANSQNQTLFVTGTVTFDPATSLVGEHASVSHTASVNSRVKHPLKSNLTTSTVNQHSFLVFSGSESGNINTNEPMDGEKYRLQSGSYATQNSVTNAGNKWDSSISVNDVGSYIRYSNGLSLYGGKLLSPSKGGLSGDYRSVVNGGVLQSPGGNPNYSSLATTTREYYRYFRSNQVGDVSLATVTLYGDANLVAKGGAFNTGAVGANKNIHCEVKIPGDTGWLDMARPANVGENITNDVGGFNGGGGDVNQTVDADGTSYGINFRTATLNGTSGGNADYLVVRITAHKDWTGYLSRISFVYGS